MKNSSISGSGFLFFVFLVLKLTNVISWSWWWVTAPLWLPTVVGLWMILFAVACLLGICTAVAVLESKV